MAMTAAIMVDGLTVGTITVGHDDEVPAFPALAMLTPSDDQMGDVSMPHMGGDGHRYAGESQHHRRLGGGSHGQSHGGHGHHRYLEPKTRARQNAEEVDHVPHFKTGDIKTAVEGHEKTKPEHFKVGDVQSVVKGESGLKGSAYLKHERAWIDDELKNKPHLRGYVRDLLKKEHEGGETKVMESMANRLNLLRRQGQPNLTVEEYLNRTGRNQFYAPIREGRVHEIESAASDRAIENVIGGSNEIRGMTDQGSRGAPNFGRPETIYDRGEGYSDFQGAAGAKEYREDQQRRVAQGGSAGDKPVGVESLERNLPVGVTRLVGDAAAGTSAGAIAPGAMTAVGGQPPKAFIMHHTGGGGTPEGVQNTLRQRGLGVEYIMDRDGNIIRAGGPGAANILPGWGAGAGLNNSNIVGMEVIGRDDKDINPKQIESAKRFIRENYPNTPVFGHGEVNPGHKEADEGMSIVNAIRRERSQQSNKPVGPQSSLDRVHFGESLDKQPALKRIAALSSNDYTGGDQEYEGAPGDKIRRNLKNQERMRPPWKHIEPGQPITPGEQSKDPRFAPFLPQVRDIKKI